MDDWTKSKLNQRLNRIEFEKEVKEELEKIYAAALDNLNEDLDDLENEERDIIKRLEKKGEINER